MPTIKLYTIVTNDKYEFPIACDLIGAKSVAKYMNKQIGTIRKNISSGRWSGKYKAIPDGVYIPSEFEQALKNSKRCRTYYRRKKEKEREKMKNNENVIEFLVGDKTCTVTFTNQKHINKIKKLHDNYADEFGYYVENPDGSICAKIPLKWIKINRTSPRELTEEEKEKLRQRMSTMRNAKHLQTNLGE